MAPSPWTCRQLRLADHTVLTVFTVLTVPFTVPFTVTAS